MINLIMDMENRGTLRKPNILFTVWVRGKKKMLSTTSPSADEAIATLVSAHSDIKPHLIESVLVSKTDEGCLAFIKNWTNDTFAFGATKEEALGALIRTNQPLFGIKISYPRK